MAPPCFVVVGKTSAGKSTLLQRLTRLPFFPVDEQICTRMAVKVELRKGLGESKAAIAVCRFEDKDVFVAGGKAISMEADSQDVQQAMDALLKEQGLSKTPVIGAETSQVITTKELRIRVTSPTLPVLDLVDLPGRLLDGSATGQATQQLFKRYAKTSHNHSIFICVVNAILPQVEWHVAELLGQADSKLAQMQLPKRALGVFTKCDKMDADTTTLQECLRHNVEPQLGHGFLAIGARVKDTSDREQKVFADLFQGECLDILDRTSIWALQSKLLKLYKDQLYHQTLQQLVEFWLRSKFMAATAHMKHCDEMVAGLLQRYKDVQNLEISGFDFVAISKAVNGKGGEAGPCETLVKNWLKAGKPLLLQVYKCLQRVALTPKTQASKS
eukprot:Skav217586  [mRNA]  locus=scaffold3512:24023:25180:- [translate_table: standard]